MSTKASPPTAKTAHPSSPASRGQPPIEHLAAYLTSGLGLAAGATLVAGVVHGYTGFGAALITMPLLSVIYGPVEALAISAIVGIAGAIQLSWGAVRVAHWPELAPVIAGTVIATPIGAYFLFTLDPDIVRRSIGAFVLIATIVLMSGWTYTGPRGIAVGGAVGALGGAVSGVAGVGGPVVVVYFLAAPLAVPVRRANIVIAVATFVLVITVSLTVGGAMTPETITRGVLLLAPYILGTWLGSRLFANAPEAIYRRAAMGLLIAASISALVG